MSKTAFYTFRLLKLKTIKRFLTTPVYMHDRYGLKYQSSVNRNIVKHLTWSRLPRRSNTIFQEVKMWWKVLIATITLSLILTGQDLCLRRIVSKIHKAALYKPLFTAHNACNFFLLPKVSSCVILRWDTSILFWSWYLYRWITTAFKQKHILHVSLSAHLDILCWGHIY